MSWSWIDKRDLLVALEAHGPNNLTEIQKYLPNKSIMEIRCTIQKFKQLAHSKEKNSEANESNGVLNEWIQLLKGMQSSHNINDLYPRLFKYIALFENHSFETGVDLRECYLAISELMKGESIKNLAPSSVKFLQECLTELANRINCRDKTEFLDFIKGLGNMEYLTKSNLVRSYSKKKEDHTMNPLRVPDKLLKLNNDVGPSTSSDPSTSSQQ